MVSSVSLDGLFEEVELTLRKIEVQAGLIKDSDMEAQCKKLRKRLYRARNNFLYLLDEIDYEAVSLYGTDAEGNRRKAHEAIHRMIVGLNDGEPELPNNVILLPLKPPEESDSKDPL